MRTVKEDEIESITRALNNLRVAREETNGRFNRQERALHILLSRATGVAIPSEPITVPSDHSPQIAEDILSQGSIDLPNTVKSEPSITNTPIEPIKEVFQDISSPRDLKPGDLVCITNQRNTH